MDKSRRDELRRLDDAMNLGPLRTVDRASAHRGAIEATEPGIEVIAETYCGAWGRPHGAQIAEYLAAAANALPELLDALDELEDRIRGLERENAAMREAIEAECLEVRHG